MRFIIVLIVYPKYLNKVSITTINYYYTPPPNPCDIRFYTTPATIPSHENPFKILSSSLIQFGLPLQILMRIQVVLKLNENNVTIPLYFTKPIFPDQHHESSSTKIGGGD